MSKRLTTQEFIKMSIELFTDKYNYTELGKIKSEITDSIKNKNYKTK